LPKLNLAGLIAWVAGIAAYQAMSRLAPQVGATLPAFAVAAMAYIALRLARRS
jgi:NCS1 family nucleobase:cation symporter-1